MFADLVGAAMDENEAGNGDLQPSLMPRRQTVEQETTITNFYITNEVVEIEGVYLYIILCL